MLVCVSADQGAIRPGIVYTRGDPLGAAHPHVGPTTTSAGVAAQRSQAALADKLVDGIGPAAGVSSAVQARTAH